MGIHLVLRMLNLFDTILDKRTNTVRRSNFIIGKTPIQFNVIDTHTILQNSQNRLHRFNRWQWAFYHGTYCKMTLIKQFNRSPIGTGPYFRSWQAAICSTGAMMGITLVLQN